MKMMKTLRAFGPQDIRLVEIPIPQPSFGEVQIRVKVCGVCGSDKWFWNVSEASDYTAGHEACGEVSQVGPGCTWAKLGDRVAINNVRGCGTCAECISGRYVRCKQLIHMGQGFGQYLVAPERNLLQIDNSIDWESAALIFDLWGTPYGALERIPNIAGKTLVVSGCGPIGLAAIKLATLKGAHVMGVDLLDDRLEMAKQLGASAICKAGPESTQAILDWTKNAGVDVFLECAGKANSYELAWNVLGMGSHMVTIGEGAHLENLEPSHILINKHLTWIGHLYSTMEHGKAIHDMIIHRSFDPKAFVSHRYTVEELPKVFGHIVSGGQGLLKTLVIVDE
jgi:threonine dehydrogenase-like Zn-dependent dehydrogenase